MQGKQDIEVMRNRAKVLYKIFPFVSSFQIDELIKDDFFVECVNRPINNRLPITDEVFLEVVKEALAHHLELRAQGKWEGFSFRAARNTIKRLQKHIANQ